MINKEEIEDLQYQINMKDIKIYELNTKIKELEEINKEHQKLIGELETKLTEYESKED